MAWDSHTHTHTHTHPYGQFSISSSPILHIFGLCKTGAPCGTLRRHRNSTHTAPRLSRDSTLLLWGDRATHWASVSPVFRL